MFIYDKDSNAVINTKTKERLLTNQGEAWTDGSAQAFIQSQLKNNSALFYDQSLNIVVDNKASKQYPNHPETGKAWTQETADAFIAAYQAPKPAKIITHEQFLALFTLHQVAAIKQLTKDDAVANNLISADDYPILDAAWDLVVKAHIAVNLDSPNTIAMLDILVKYMAISADDKPRILAVEAPA